MKRFFVIIAFLLASGRLSCDAAAGPNFVLILGEAQGWASMSEPLDDRDPAGSRSDIIRTPHLDSLARAGVRFSDFYAASPRCTPTRAALVTGRSPAQLHMTFVNEGGKGGGPSPGDKVIAPQGTTELPTGLGTMAEVLKHAGYATAHFGKWHLGRESPEAYGFDENDGTNSNGGPEDVESPNPKQAYAIARQGINFIRRQAQAGRPFFLQLSEYPCRGEETALPETVEAVKRRLGSRMDFRRIGEAAGDEEIDKTIGQVLGALRESGVMGSTYVIYTADHGAQGRNANGRLSNGKGTVWEGGLRVPLVVAGPEVKAGAFVHSRASTVDLLPTVAALAGLEPDVLPRGIEGGSLAALIRQGKDAPVQRPREGLVIHFPHYDKDDLGPASAMLLGNYKLIRFYEEGTRRRLFDVSIDPGEQNDLAGTNPGMMATLDARLDDYLKAVHAAIPDPNPAYDSNGRRSGDRGGRKGPKKNNGSK